MPSGIAQSNVFAARIVANVHPGASNEVEVCPETIAVGVLPEKVNGATGKAARLILDSLMFLSVGVGDREATLLTSWCNTEKRGGFVASDSATELSVLWLSNGAGLRRA